MLVLSSPSGAGKTSIARELLAIDDNLQMSVSATTRPRRPGEVHGVDYAFVEPNEFRDMIDDKKLLEYAKVFDYYYGTPRQPVEEALASGRDILFDIDWQGTQQLAEHAGEDLIRVFNLLSNSLVDGGSINTLIKSSPACSANCWVPCQSISNKISRPDANAASTGCLGVP